MTTITERLHEAMPELKNQRRVAEELAQFKHAGNSSSTRYEVEARDLVKKHVLEIVQKGQEIPEDVARPVLEAQERDALANLRSQILNVLARQESSAEQHALTNNADKGFAFLAAELKQLISEVRSLAPSLREVRSAEEAIDAGTKAVTAWKRVSDRTRDYDEIRQLQFQLTRGLEKMTSQTFLDSGLLADAIDVQGFWIAKRLSSASAPQPLNALNSGSFGDAAVAYRSWLTERLPKQTFDYTSTWWQEGESKPQHLLRLATTAEPWLPTVDELLNARDLAIAATYPPGGDRGQELSRRSYYELTGATPRVALPEPPKVIRGSSGLAATEKQQKAFKKKLDNAAAKSGIDRRIRQEREDMERARAL